MITLETMDNGFQTITIENRSAAAKIALQGAHLFHYQAKGKAALLWLSETSFFETGQSIRGGVPICWPWFGMPKDDMTLPQHGFARTSLWEYMDADETDDETTQITLQLTHSTESLALWPHKFKLILNITIGKTLSMSLTTENCDDKAFEVTSALHTYFNISAIENISVEGLDQHRYLNALTGKYNLQNGNIIIDREVDRVYQKVSSPLFLIDKKRTIEINNEGSSSVVVWNPWIKKCARMSAMKDDAYKSMLCIETANAFEDTRTIQPNQSHTLTTTYKEI